MTEQTNNIDLVDTIIVLRNDSTVAWESSSYILLPAEVGVEFSPYVGAENAKTKLKIGDGIHTWAELPYFGEENTHVYEITINKGSNHVTAIDTKLQGIALKTGDIAIIKEPIINEELLSETILQKYQYTAYHWNSSTWEAFDGNYSAKNIILDSDFVFTAPVGVITQKNIDDNNGSVIRAATGKNIQDFFAGVFAEEKLPSITMPSISWITEPKATVEVGTEIIPAYNVKLNAGSYSYGPVTGITANSWDVAITDLADDNIAADSGTFSKFTALDGMRDYAKVTATASYEAGAVPITNIGNACPAKQINAGTKSVTSAGYTAYRAWFCGYKAGGSTLNIAELDSDTIRGLTAANGSFTTSMTTTNMQQMFFAAPAGLVKSVAVAHSVNGAPQTVKQTTVYVKGQNNYVVAEADRTELNTLNGMKYDLFYVSNDNANSGSATYTITTTKF